MIRILLKNQTHKHNLNAYDARFLSTALKPHKSKRKDESLEEKYADEFKPNIRFADLTKVRRCEDKLFWGFAEDIVKTYFPTKSLYRDDLRKGMNLLYQDLLDQLNVDEFITEFKLPDTFDSWFKIMELHIYMLSARLIADGYLGFPTRDYLWDTFWKDVKHRYKRISIHKDRFEKEHFWMYRRVSKYALAGYDEGLQAGDKELASALWRRFFSSQCNDAFLLERLVMYIRLQITFLRRFDLRTIVFQKHNWFIQLSDIQVNDVINSPMFRQISRI